MLLEEDPIVLEAILLNPTLGTKEDMPFLACGFVPFRTSLVGFVALSFVIGSSLLVITVNLDPLDDPVLVVSLWGIIFLKKVSDHYL